MALRQRYKSALSTYNRSVAGAFAAYARLVANHAWVCFVVGVVILMLSFAGLQDMYATSDYRNLWMYRGTRMDSEKAFSDEHFGDATRFQNLLVSRADGGNIATQEGLDATMSGLAFMDQESGSDVLDFTFDGNTYALSNVCERSTVPVALRPYAAVPLGWMDPNGGTGQVLSYGYHFMANCTKYTGGVGQHPVTLELITAPEDDIELGWGVDRFPCTWASPLDCFAEGRVGYPEAMQQADEWSNFIMFNSNRATCLAQAQDTYEEAFTLALSFTSMDADTIAATAVAYAESAATSLDSIVNAFFAWGYQWRLSYKDMTDDQIVAHIGTAMASADDGTLDASNCALASLPCCLSWAATKLDNGLLFTNPSYDNDGNLEGVQYMMSLLSNFADRHPAWADYIQTTFEVEDEDTREDIMKGWEQLYIDRLMPAFEKEAGTGYAKGEELEGVNIDFFSDRSGVDIIEEGNKIEVALVIVAYVVMIVFASLSMGSWSCSSMASTVVYSRVLLSLGGVIVILLSTVATFGFTGAVGLELTPLQINIIPFLSLGIGIDDMFILTYTLVRTVDCPDDPVKRLEKSLAHAGPSVVVTSLANAGCFLVASHIPINVIRFFSYQMGIQMLYHLVLLHLLFVPMMYWDSLRVCAGRADVFLNKVDKNALEPEDSFVAHGSMSRFIHKYYAPLLRNKAFKAVAIVGVLALTAGLAWYGVAEHVEGLSLSNIAFEGTYQKSFVQVYEEEYEAEGISLITKDTVDLATYQQTILDTQAILQDSSWVSQTMRIRDVSWLQSLLGYAAGLGLTEDNTTPLAPELFDATFEAWIKSVGITNSNNFYCVDTATGERVDCSEFSTGSTSIKASSQNVFLVGQDSVDSAVSMIEDLRERVDSVDDSGDIYVYGRNAFLLNSQYLYTWETFGYLIGAGAAVVAGVLTVLEGSLTLSLIIATAIVTVVMQVFGVLVSLGIKINGFSLVNLCVLLGLTVEFTAHIGRGFLFASGSKAERTEEALVELMYPTFAGAMTTFLAVLPLTFSDITFFHTYYFQTYSVMVAFALAMGICLLPIMLSLVGPESQSLGKELDFVVQGGSHAGDPAQQAADTGPRRQASHGSAAVMGSSLSAHVNPIHAYAADEAKDSEFLGEPLPEKAGRI